ncbi:MalM family protein [Vibrio sp. JC009]|uniref:MalM family protein n=1 Tax=Vibrio sp. JC009 TaxID=2912314 RepID=UPI0023B18E1C|nr:MalM family protein [Vibrio sp. JC009]WED23882.1 MalM family protein [Vibrio sp. JC009]
MRYTKIALIVGIALSVSACSNNKSMVVDYGSSEINKVQSVNPEVGYKALASASECCSSLSELDFQQIEGPGKYDFFITPESEAFRFATGKSFVKGVELPEATGTIKVAVSSSIAKNVFVPSIVLLDKQFKPVKLLSEESIRYQDASLMHGERYFGEVEVKAVANAPKYLLVFTTEKAMNQTTELPPLSDDAVGLGRADDVDRIYRNKPVPHTATGTFRLAFDYDPDSSSEAQAVLGNDVNEDVKKAKTVLPAAAVPAVEAKDEMAGVQPETEIMFIELIERAVSQGKLDKAMKLVEDAERAGSLKARDALIEALKK